MKIAQLLFCLLITSNLWSQDKKNISGKVIGLIAGGEGGEEGCDLAGFEVVDESCEHGADFQLGTGGGEEVGDGVEDTRDGFHIGDAFMNHGEVHFQTKCRGAGVEKVKKALFFVRGKINANGGHIPDDLGAGFFEGEIEAGFAVAAGGGGEVGGKGGFAGAGGAGDEDGGTAIEAFSAEHFIESGNAG